MRLSLLEVAAVILKAALFFAVVAALTALAMRAADQRGSESRPVDEFPTLPATSAGPCDLPRCRCREFAAPRPL